MAVYNSSSGYYGPTQPNQPINKVFINPNFNKGIVKCNDVSIKPPSNVMHINPKFTHIVNTQNKTIHLNPNFIQTSYNQNHYLKPDKPIDSLSSQRSENADYLRNNFANTANVSLPPQNKTTHNNQNLQPVSVKSRYCLVRNNVHKPTAPKQDEVKKTVKLSKYKSVRIKDVKRNLDTLKEMNKPLQLMAQPRTINNSNSPSIVYKSQFKFIKHKIDRNVSQSKNLKSSVKHPVAKILSTDSVRRNTLLKSENRRNLKYVKGSFKKNNIPCPLFRKYGKCLRNIRGFCEYLHDKKHVSICRKFLKGKCYDTDCILSHELTDKKMPTCHFYLQGMCTKDNCPYLHVKLNEKTQICSDFIKGYCEKGEKCLKRHINIRNSKKKQISLKRHKSSNVNKKALEKIKDSKAIIKDAIENTLPDRSEQNTNIADRYYTESKKDMNTDESDSYEVIKPTRCKLGTLPSFIKL